MTTPSDFYSISSMLTLSGATGATFVVCNGLQSAFNFNPKWLALAVAEVIVLVGCAYTGKREPIDFFVAFINGFLVYCSAAGVTGGANALAKGKTSAAVTARGRTVRGSAEPQPDDRRRFLSAWF